jgi:hypothetical protein
MAGPSAGPSRPEPRQRLKLILRSSATHYGGWRTSHSRTRPNDSLCPCVYSTWIGRIALSAPICPVLPYPRTPVPLRLASVLVSPLSSDGGPSTRTNVQPFSRIFTIVPCFYLNSNTQAVTLLPGPGLASRYLYLATLVPLQVGHSAARRCSHKDSVYIYLGSWFYSRYLYLAANPCTLFLTPYPRFSSCI